MKKYFLFLFLFNLLLSVTEGQQIVVDKDSLRIFGNDTLYVYNTDSTKLVIDSLYSVNPAYGYWLNISIKDSSFFYYTAYYYATVPLEIILAQNDTAKFIFGNVDLCTFCKRNSQNEYFQDTLILISNSKLNDTLLLFVEGDGTLSSIDNNKDLPVEYQLYQNYPNPFNPTTTIKYQIVSPNIVTLKIYDVLGREIKTIVNQYQNAGRYNTTFNAVGLSSGVYIYVLKSGSYIESKKLILLK